MRVHELAKKYNMSSKECVDALKAKGIDVKNHMSSLSAEDLMIALEVLTSDVAPLKQTSKVNKTSILAVVKTKEIKVKKSKIKKVPVLKPKDAHSLPIIDSVIDDDIIDDDIVDDDIDPIYVGGFQKIETKSVKKEKQKKEPKKIQIQEVIKKEPVVAEKKVIRVNFPINVKNLALKMELPANTLISKLLKLGIIASLNQDLDEDTVVILAEEFGCIIEKIENVVQQKFTVDIVEEEEKITDLKPRAPVVTFMGHVDHGKTSLLDSIRKTNVVSSESGGITQHIGAYEISVDSHGEQKKITFLDTPGHEAFTAMRARGAHATDICVLVVAADDGIMPQTIEAINHIKAAKVPVIVAINKIDRPNAQIDRVKNQLAQYELAAEDWGGDTIVVETSAETKAGIDTLLEMILLQAEMGELKANPNCKAKGVVIESKMTKGRGPTATILVQKGTLKVGDHVICGLVYGKVKALYNYLGERVTSAGPSMPVEVLGLSVVPRAGDIFNVVGSEKETKFVSEARKRLEQEKETSSRGNLTIDDLYQQMANNTLKELKLIVKSDVQGSIEAITKVIGDLKADEVIVDVIHGAVGAINESDVMLAKASNAMIIGFRVKLESASISDLLKRENVIIRFYDVIYNIVDDVRAAMEGLLDPEKHENILGHAEVRRLFKISRLGVIAGCFVTDGKILRNAKARIKRGDSILMETTLASLKKFKEEVREVQSGTECGIRLNKFNEFEEGDIIEIFEVLEKKRTLK